MSLFSTQNGFHDLLYGSISNYAVDMSVGANGDVCIAYTNQPALIEYSSVGDTFNVIPVTVAGSLFGVGAKISNIGASLKHVLCSDSTVYLIDVDTPVDPIDQVSIPANLFAYQGIAQGASEGSENEYSIVVQDTSDSFFKIYRLSWDGLAVQFDLDYTFSADISAAAGVRYYGNYTSMVTVYNGVSLEWEMHEYNNYIGGALLYTFPQKPVAIFDGTDSATSLNYTLALMDNGDLWFNHSGKPFPQVYTPAITNRTLSSIVYNPDNQKIMGVLIDTAIAAPSDAVVLKNFVLTLTDIGGGEYEITSLSFDGEEELAKTLTPGEILRVVTPVPNGIFSIPPP